MNQGLKHLAQLHDENIELKKEIERLKGEREWISVKDILPEFGELVLVYCTIHGRFLATYEYIGDFKDQKYGNWRDCKENLGILPPIYWLKLPEPPKQ